MSCQQLYRRSVGKIVFRPEGDFISPRHVGENHTTNRSCCLRHGLSGQMTTEIMFVVFLFISRAKRRLNINIHDAVTPDFKAQFGCCKSLVLYFNRLALITFRPQ